MAVVRVGAIKTRQFYWLTGRGLERRLSREERTQKGVNVNKMDSLIGAVACGTLG